MFFRTFAIALVGGILLAAAPLAARSWQEISDSGSLRVLTTDTARETVQIAGLPRRVMPIDREQALLESFARKYGLQVVYVKGKDFKMLFRLLDLGQGDLISANLAETTARDTRYLLSMPFARTREIVFTSQKSKIKGNSWKSLAGSTGFLLPGTTYVENFRSAAQGKKNVKFRELKTTIPHDELIEQVHSGKIAYSVLNESSLDAWLAYRKGIRKIFTLRDQVPLVFAAQSNSVELIDKLDQFIWDLSHSEAAPNETAEKPKASEASDPPENDPERSTADLPVIRKRGYIRMLTFNDAFGCFLHRGQLMGFEYELAKRFGEGIKTRISTVMVDDIDEVCRFLIEGRGDFIAANFSLTPERIRKYPQLTFCTPYGGTTQVVVGRSDETISSVAELAGRRVAVHRGGNCYDTLLKLQKSGIDFEIETVPMEVANFVLLEDLVSGKYDLVATDDNFVTIANAQNVSAKKLFALKPREKFVWVVRKKNPKLAAAVNAFFARENKSAFFNICYKRYYSATPLPKVKVDKGMQNLTAISPYDSIFRKYASLYGFNWYYIAAQAYQESRFNAGRVNEIGATGLMQVMPDTAKEIGIAKLTDPENGVHAGTKYLAKLHRRFDDETITPENQFCFSLAAYNAGYGHVQDARRLAARLGLDPNVWFGNTEKALALLENPSYAARAKFGYCRASETIPYVANIMLQAHHYETLNLIQTERVNQIKKNSRDAKGQK